MHFHLPKPLHGWREFVGEVGIIVIGVLIALGAEQVVESWNWRHQAEDAASALRSEVSGHYLAAAEFIVVAPCLDRQLQLLSQRLTATPLKPAPLFHVAGLNYVLRAPSRPWSDNQWRGVASEGVAAHLPKDLRANLGDHYALITVIRDDNRAADTLAYRFTVLAQSAALDPATRGRLAEEIEEQRGIFSFMGLVASQIVASARAMGFAPPRQEVDEYLAKSGTTKFCRAHGLPLGKLA